MDKSHQNKRDVRKVEKALKYEFRRCEAEAMDKNTEDLEDAAKRHKSKIFYLHVKKLRGSSQSGLAQVKNQHEATIFYRERVKERLVEHFENVINWD